MIVSISVVAVAIAAFLRVIVSISAVAFDNHRYHVKNLTEIYEVVANKRVDISRNIFVEFSFRPTLSKFLIYENVRELLCLKHLLLISITDQLYIRHNFFQYVLKFVLTYH